MSYNLNSLKGGYMGIIQGGVYLRGYERGILGVLTTVHPKP